MVLVVLSHGIITTLLGVICFHVVLRDVLKPYTLVFSTQIPRGELSRLHAGNSMLFNETTQKQNEINAVIIC